MKQMLKQFYQKTSGSWGVLVIAVALLLTVGSAPTFANTQGVVDASSFRSPLPGPDGHNGDGNRLEDLLDGIVDLDETMADALGITVEELEAAREAGTSLEELIDELGLDSDTVHQTVQDAIEAAVEQAVEDGLLTEEEAEAILNPPAPHNGDTPPADDNGGNRLEDLLDGIVDLDETMADALGITVEELEAAREAGTTLEELIDELGLDSDTVHQTVQDAIEAAVEQAVEDGLLTEEEAEAILNPPAPHNGDTPPADDSGDSNPSPGPGGPHSDTPPADDNGGTTPNSATDNSPGTDSGAPDRPERGSQGGDSQGGGSQGGGSQGGGSQGGGGNRGGRP